MNNLICINCGNSFIWNRYKKCCNLNCLKTYMSNKYKGRKLSKETINKMIGRKPYNIGKTRSEEPRIPQPWLGKKRPEISGDRNNKWKGGRRISKGYILILSKEHPQRDFHGYVWEHHLVMEKYLRRLLLPQEVVHHIDGNKKNNDISNLMLFLNHSAHMKYHASLRKKNDS